MVGVERFELPTHCSQSSCATRLRYTPTFCVIDIHNDFLFRKPFISIGVLQIAIAECGVMNVISYLNTKFMGQATIDLQHRI